MGELSQLTAYQLNQFDRIVIYRLIRSSFRTHIHLINIIGLYLTPLVVIKDWAIRFIMNCTVVVFIK